jgi:putative FmdB family regulatory protein
MPTYEYLCRGCGTRLEVVQSFSEDALTVCESCGGELRKVFSAAGLIFKGSGWHIKDYASSGGSSAPSSAQGGASGGSSDASSGGSSGDGAAAPSKPSSAASGSSGTTTAAPAKPAAGSSD